jgi:spore photoproduct lyase
VRRERSVWIPKRVLATPDALSWPYGRTIAERAASLGADVVELKSNRVVLPRDSRISPYAAAKSTLALVTASPSARRPRPIPPSADWQFHVAQGCPAHCQYCYLAGSLSGPPMTRVYANLPEILAELDSLEGQGTVTSAAGSTRNHEGTTFEMSCYTDPLGIEHLTGALDHCIRHFGSWDAPVQLRWTTKFSAVEPLLGLAHNGRTRVRFSVSAPEVMSRFEGGTSPLVARMDALRKMAIAAYPVGLTIAPIMPVAGWQEQYRSLLESVGSALAGVSSVDLTVEMITHRFTQKSKRVLLDWYPNTRVELDENRRTVKRTKMGTSKYVYPAAEMREMRAWFYGAIPEHLPHARILYWT